MKTVFGVVDQVLDKQFPFLPSIDGASLKEILSTIPVGGVVDEDYLASKRAMGGELFNACRENIRRHVGSDWALVKYDQELAHNVRLATRQNLEIYEADFQP